MKKRILSRISLALAALLTIVLFQNCASDFRIEEYNEGSRNSSSNGGNTGGGNADPGTPTNPSDPSNPTPTPPPNDTPVIGEPVQVTAGERSSCALRADGTAFCWGLNSSGQLGTGNTTQYNTPTPVLTNLKFKKISMGSMGSVSAAYRATTCGVTTSGTVYCWGSNTDGQIGANITPSTSNVLTPTLVPGLANVEDVKVGATTVCARTAGNQLYCWGSNRNGELGNGSTALNSALPVLVALNNVADFDVSRSTSQSYLLNRVCAVTTNGELYCWGYAYLGSPVSSAFSRTPVKIDFPTIEKVRIGLHSTCGRNALKQLICSGYGVYIGVGTAQDLPPRVIISANVEEFSIAYQQGCAILTGGSLHCFGLNSFIFNNTTIATGQLGLPAQIQSAPTPTMVIGISGATRVDAGVDHTCVGYTNNIVQCFGNNDFGGLGNATTNSTHIPQTASIP